MSKQPYPEPGPILTLGTPRDITDPMAFMERLMRGDKRGELLRYLARRLLKDPTLKNWFMPIPRLHGVVVVRCCICDAELSAGQKTMGVATKKLVAEHGKIHIDEALQGKYENNP